MLEVPDGGVTKKRSSVQHHGKVPSWDFCLAVTSPIYDNPLTGKPCLGDLSLFAPSLYLGLLGGSSLSLFYYLISLLILLPLFVSMARLGSVGGGKGGGLL